MTEQLRHDDLELIASRLSHALGVEISQFKGKAYCIDTSEVLENLPTEWIPIPVSESKILDAYRLLMLGTVDDVLVSSIILQQAASNYHNNRYSTPSVPQVNGAVIRYLMAFEDVNRENLHLNPLVPLSDVPKSRNENQFKAPHYMSVFNG